MGFLTELTTSIRRALEARPLDEAALTARAMAMPPARDFGAALTGPEVAMIAEVKRASPSAGAIDDDADAVVTARAFVAGGAAAISVLTEPTRFHGSLLDLQAVHASVAVPVLRKDFLVHPAQVIEARAHGADAVLLITACLDDAELRAMLALAADLGMACLVETHTEPDLERALASGARLIGVNARNLETLDVDRPAAWGMLGRIPADRIRVVESGVSTRADVEAAAAAGASAILVGEALMRAGDPAAALRALRGKE